MVRLREDDDFPPRMYTFAHVFLIRGYVDSVTEVGFISDCSTVSDVLPLTVADSRAN